jgi:type III restriction enzyme
MSQVRNDLLVPGRPDSRLMRPSGMRGYRQERFESEELTGYLKNAVAAKKAVYDHVVCDSDIEREFAADCEKNADVKVYAKLPAWFKVPTPLGDYEPDWAVLVEKGGKERLYFVAETKGTLSAIGLRPTEQAKIDCGKAHFAALAEGEANPARFVTATSLADVLMHT